MAKLTERKLIKVGKSTGITLPKETAEQLRKNKKKYVWVVILDESEEPTSERLLKWIYNGL